MVTIGLIFLSAVFVYFAVVAYTVSDRLRSPTNNSTLGTIGKSTPLDRQRRERMLALILALVASYIGHAYLHYRMYSVSAMNYMDESLEEPLLVSYSVKSFGFVVHEKQAKAGEDLRGEVETYRFMGRIGLFIVIVNIGIASYYAVRILLHRWRGEVAMLLPQRGNRQ